MRPMQGHTALVIGDGGEVGQAVAQAFVQQGAFVYIAAPHAEDAPGVQSLTVDLLDEASIQAVIGTVRHLHYAVNLAVMPEELPAIATLDYSDWTGFMNRHLRSLFLCVKHEIRMMQHSGGAITNVTVATSARTAAGAMTVAEGVLGLIRSAGLGYAGDGVRVNALQADLDTSLPAIAELALWLCSDRASYVTGQRIMTGI